MHQPCVVAPQVRPSARHHRGLSKWFVWLLAAAGCLAILPAMAEEVLPAPLIGLWRVEDSACRGCDPARGAEAGAELRLTPLYYQNPFQDDCLQAPVAQLQPAERVAELQARLGLPARWLGPADGPDKPVRSWRLSCGKGQSFLVILLPDGSLLLPVEASTTLRLLHRG